MIKRGPLIFLTDSESQHRKNGYMPYIDIRSSGSHLGLTSAREQALAFHNTFPPKTAQYRRCANSLETKGNVFVLFYFVFQNVSERGGQILFSLPISSVIIFVPIYLWWTKLELVKYTHWSLVSLPHLFIYLFIYLFIHSFIHSFIHFTFQLLNSLLPVSPHIVPSQPLPISPPRGWRPTLGIPSTWHMKFLQD